MRAVILCGGEIAEYDRVRSRIAEDDMIICADSGYRHAKKMGLRPAVVLGDFDSYARTDVECDHVLTYPAKKDYTDSEIAVRYALEHGCDAILLLGATGGRIDHTLGNLSLMDYILQRGASGELYDGVSSVWMAQGTITVSGQAGDLLSVIPFAEAGDLTTHGLAYPLRHQALAGASTGISNVFETDCVQLEIGSGKAIVVHTPQGLDKMD